MNGGSRLPAFFHLLRLAEVDSTNEEAKRQAKAGAGEGLVVWADRQSAGRGRQGRAWRSPPGNLYVSILLRPGRGAAEAAQLSFAAAVAVADVLAPLLPENAAPRLKWPNDVLIAGRKVAGILLESQATGGVLDALVVGIGINLVSYPEDAGTRAISLAAAGAGAATADAVLAALLDCFLARYETWRTQGFAPLRAAWLDRAHGLGGEIRVRQARLDTVGRFVDLDPAGALVLENESGRQNISAGSVFPVG